MVQKIKLHIRGINVIRFDEINKYINANDFLEYKGKYNM